MERIVRALVLFHVFRLFWLIECERVCVCVNVWEEMSTAKRIVCDVENRPRNNKFYWCIESNIYFMVEHDLKVMSWKEACEKPSCSSQSDKSWTELEVWQEPKYRRYDGSWFVTIIGKEGFFLEFCEQLISFTHERVKREDVYLFLVQELINRFTFNHQSPDELRKVSQGIETFKFK